MRRRPTQPLDDLASEMDALRREYESMIDDTRAGWLEARIAERKGLPVRRARTTLSGERVALLLADGTLVEMELLVPQRERLATLSAVRRRCSNSWIIRGRTTAGEHVTYLAARVRISSAADVERRNAHHEF